MPAGHIAASLKLPPSALTFHLDRLREAGLIAVRRDGRSMIYAARVEAMNALVSYLTDQCCQGRPDLCAPARPAAARKSEKVR
jgi:ArsR family transcriptional regulator